MARSPAYFHCDTAGQLRPGANAKAIPTSELDAAADARYGLPQAGSGDARITRAARASTGRAAN
jgi:hypothetical protein